MHKEARLMSLTADITALTGLFDEQKAQLATHPKIIRLSKKSKELAARIKRLEYINVRAAKGTPLYDRKKKVDAALKRTRVEIRDKM
jgi:hypothetical protein